MSRFLLRNTVRDPKFAALRKKNESRVVLRPFIGGKPLPPAATRVLVLSDLTPTLLNEIEQLVVIGCVEMLVVGRTGPSVDFAVLRKELGHVAADPVAVVAPVVVEVVPTVETAAAAAVETIVVPTEPEPAPETSIEESEAAPEITTEPETTPDKVWSREELEALKLAELRDIVAAQGGKWAGKNKAALVDDILTAQGGV